MFARPRQGRHAVVSFLYDTEKYPNVDNVVISGFTKGYSEALAFAKKMKAERYTRAERFTIKTRLIG